ncbi:Os07g0495950 [Oryza sativa Japonica Group]|uniref:Os07g0495950 protein n=1 Tax=Oryza sativa subsp. japonica TaxID=39947 RepID=A0A0P0X649_ORYSJ|nr:Os07g0495950 [Oryza sativa Japonica Group]
MPFVLLADGDLDGDDDPRCRSSPEDRKLPYDIIVRSEIADGGDGSGRLDSSYFVDTMSNLNSNILLGYLKNRATTATGIARLHRRLQPRCHVDPSAPGEAIGTAAAVSLAPVVVAGAVSLAPVVVTGAAPNAAEISIGELGFADNGE